MTVTVTDGGKPTATCTDVTKECTGPQTPITTSCSATDACDGAIEPSNSAAATYPLGQHTYVCSANDAAGNLGSDTCSFTVTDFVKPTFTFVPTAITITACESPNLGQATATDLCGTVLVSNNAPAKFPLGDTRVTWYALDHGNY